jgi:hypothetical protein
MCPLTPTIKNQSMVVIMSVKKITEKKFLKFFEIFKNFKFLSLFTAGPFFLGFWLSVIGDPTGGTKLHGQYIYTELFWRRSRDKFIKIFRNFFRFENSPGDTLEIFILEKFEI